MPPALFLVGCLSCSAAPLPLSPDKARAELEDAMAKLQERVDNAETELAALVKDKAERDEDHADDWKKGRMEDDD